MKKAPKRPFSLHVVLVRTIYDSNIGSSSRAMANMGVESLILINPQCEVTYAAQQAAATGQTALQSRKVYTDWSSFHTHEPEGIRIGLTARDGRGRAVKDLAECLGWISENAPEMQAEGGASQPYPIYLIFGPEDWGLSAEDLELTHFACSIPTYGDNTSLNLAQAVLLALFIVRENWGGSRAILEGQERGLRASQQAVFPEESLKTWLEEMGFDLSKPKTNVYSVLKRMLLHNTPTQKELVILETVLQQSIRKLKEYNELRKKISR